MYTWSFVYQYGVGGLIYAIGVWIALKSGILDLQDPKERKIFFWLTVCFLVFAGVHALFQFVFPFLEVKAIKGS